MSELENAASLLGSKGGNTTKEKYGSEHYRRMNQKSLATKLKKKLRKAKKRSTNLSTVQELTSGSNDAIITA